MYDVRFRLPALGLGVAEHLPGFLGREAPSFHQTYAERVEDPEAIPGALERALKVVREEKRQAMLNVICKDPFR